MHSSGNTDPTPQGDSLHSDEVTQISEEEQARLEHEARMEAIQDGREDNSGGWVRERQTDPTVSTRRSRRPSRSVRGFSDGEREELGDGSKPTADEEALARARLAEIRELHNIGVVADLPVPPLRRFHNLPEIPAPELPSPEINRILNAVASQLTKDTGISHRVYTDDDGYRVVEMIQPKK